MKKLILLRHGQSVWNKENKFTGWVDVDLSEKGIEEARRAGALMRKESIAVDLAFTSLLKRAIKTLWLALEELDQMWIPVVRAWELNERHYGALQGLDKADTAAKYGDEQVHIWRRSYDIPPPLLESDDPGHARFDARYAKLAPGQVPAGESLKITLERVLPYWEKAIAPELRARDVVLIAAHGNSLRALIKHLDGISDEEIPGLEIPTGSPLVYELNDELQPLHHYYLGG